MSLATAIDGWRDFTLDPFAQYKPRPSQDAFHRLPGRMRLFRAPNQIGKSWCGAYEAICYLKGEHPHRTLKGPQSGMLVPYSDDSCKAIEAKIWALMPPGFLHPECKYDEDRGFRVGKARVLRTSLACPVAIRGCSAAPRLPRPRPEMRRDVTTDTGRGRPRSGGSQAQQPRGNRRPRSRADSDH